MLSTYDLFLLPGINRLTWLTVCIVYKVNNRLQTSEKTTKNKKMHVLHNVFYFERAKHSCSIFTVFVRGNLFTQCSFYFLAEFLTVSFFGTALGIVTKYSILDVSGVLSPLELHVQTILFKCLTKDNNWSLWVQCISIWYESTRTRSICEVMYELTTK